MICWPSRGPFRVIASGWTRSETGWPTSSALTAGSVGKAAWSAEVQDKRLKHAKKRNEYLARNMVGSSLADGSNGASQTPSKAGKPVWAALDSVADRWPNCDGSSRLLARTARPQTRQPFLEILRQT